MSEYFTEILGNGLRVVTVEMPHLHSAEMVCHLLVGGRNEAVEQAGISHFLEHVLFRGTADYPTSFELERDFEAIGGAVNASTDAEVTCFHSRLHPDHIGKGAALFASMLLRPLFAGIELERKIILEEALEDLNERGEEISPDNLTARLLWPGHPVSYPVVGSRTSILAIGPDDLRRWHQRYYAPANAVIAVAGPVRHADVVQAVAAVFGAWPSAPPPPLPLAAPPLAAETPAIAWVEDSDSQVSVQLAFRVPGRSDERVVALRLLRRLLSWGGTSRLMLRLRETLGLTYSVEANLSLFADCGCFTIDLSLAPHNLVEAVRETLAVVEDLCRQPVGAQELSEVVRAYLFELEFSRDHADVMAGRFGWGELTGYLRTLEQDRREIAAVTPEALYRTSCELLVGSALKGAIVGPWRQKDRGAVEALLGAFRS